LEFVVEGLIWKNRTAIKHHYTVHGCDFDSLFFIGIKARYIDFPKNLNFNFGILFTYLLSIANKALRLDALPDNLKISSLDQSGYRA